MRTLFFDLSAPTGLIACIGKSDVAGSVIIDQRAGDHEVILKTKELLAEVGWQMEDLTNIACITGPGGFTSLRVEVALANALAWGLHIPIAGIHGSDMQQALAEMKEGIWIQSTKKDLLFIRGFGSFEKRWPEPVTIELASLLDALAMEKGIQFCGQLIEEHENAVASQGAVRLQEKKMNDVLPELIRSASFSERQLVPWYGRGWQS